MVAILEQEALVSGSAFSAALAKLSPEGHWRACGFHPGDYKLIAREGEGNVNRSDRVTAHADVTVADRDLTDLKLTSQPPLPISGDAIWDPPPVSHEASKPVQFVFIKRLDDDRNAERAGPRPGSFSMFSHTGKVVVPGSFTLDRLPSDDYLVQVGPLPPGCYVKTSNYAGIDVLHGLIHWTGAADARLHLVLACAGASLTARVTDREGHPVSHIKLYAFPAVTGSAATLQPVLRQADVEDGWAAFGLPFAPGKYLVLATGLKLDGSAEPILKIWSARSLAKEVEIGPNAAVQVNLEAAPIQ